MSLQVRRRLGLADGITLVNAAVGFVASVFAFTDPSLAARLILLAAIADGLDGIVARKVGNTDVGPLLDAITDVVSFGAAPGLFVYGLVRAETGGLGTAEWPILVAGITVGAAFVVFSVIRTSLYTQFVDDMHERPGVPNTLAATILCAAFLADGATVPMLLGVGAVLAVLMIAPWPYPGLLARDAFALGSIQALAILFPTRFAHVFPRALLVFALAYMVLAPRYYWRE